jgi:predicted protein tyrosine phosphatase
VGTKQQKEKEKRQKWFGSQGIIKTTNHATSSTRIEKLVAPGQSTFVPAKCLENLGSNHAVISIVDRYTDRPSLQRFAASLPLTINPQCDRPYDDHKDITPELVESVVSFVVANQDKGIVIHCGEGSVRSPALAMALEYTMDITMNQRAIGCPGHTGNADRALFMSFREVFKVLYPDGVEGFK